MPGGNQFLAGGFRVRRRLSTLDRAAMCKYRSPDIMRKRSGSVKVSIALML